LETTLRGVGANYKELKDKIDDFLISLTSATRFTRDEAADALETAVKYTGDYANGQRLLKIAMDVATGTGKSLNETISILGGAIKSDEVATRRLFTEYGKLGIQGKDVNEMLTNLGKTFAGAAKSEQSLTKETVGIRESFNEISKNIGRVLSPALVQLTPIIKVVVGGFVNGLYLLATVVADTADAVVSGFKRMVAAIKFNFSEAEKIEKEFAERSKKRWNDYINSQIQSHDLMFGKIEQNINDLGALNVKAVKDTLKTEQDAAKVREDIAKKLTDYLKKKQGETYEGAIKLLKAEIEEARKAGVDKTLIKQYENARIKELNGQLKDDLMKDQDELGEYYEDYAKQEDEKFKETYGGRIEFVKNLTDSFGDVFKDSMVELIENSKSTEEIITGMWENIKKAFINALATMVAEYIAKSVIFSTLGALFGIPPGMAGSFAGLLKGGRQQGGKIYDTGLYALHAGEEVIPKSKTQSSGSQAVNVNLNVNAFDLRQIDRIQIERLARQLSPILKKEINR
jgi:hypothetical protein